MRSGLIFAPPLLCLFPALAGGEEVITRPHLDQAARARSVLVYRVTLPAPLR